MKGADQIGFEAEYRALVDFIYAKFSYDFRDYALASMRRRLNYALERMGVESLPRLRERLTSEPRCFGELLQFLTVPVSDMFRDPSYFLALREHVLPHLKTYPSLKIWVAGCSTGEEAYSLAILLAEEGLLDRALIYATDINPRSLELAERGIFRLEEMQTFTKNYRESGGRRAFSEYYTAAFAGAIFDRALQRHITFADHSLATDNVFSEIHLVSCRNVLIYFKRELQDRAFGLFYDSLDRRGFLGLGARETVRFSAFEAKFRAFVPEERIFQKVASSVEQDGAR